MLQYTPTLVLIESIILSNVRGLLIGIPDKFESNSTLSINGSSIDLKSDISYISFDIVGQLSKRPNETYKITVYLHNNLFLKKYKHHQEVLQYEQE